MSEQSLLGVDYQNQPNFDAWWTPGWTSQNESYLPVPTNVFSAPGFPTTAKYITVTGNFFDQDGNPLSGYLTFWPSDTLTFTVNGVTTVMPQRRVGTNNTMLGINQFGDGRVYLWNGQLVVQLLATNNTGQSPPVFSYHVKEHWVGGQEYDISVPTTTAQNTDIHSLITNVPPFPDWDGDTDDLVIQIPVISTQFVPVNITMQSGSTIINPEVYNVFFSFQQVGVEPAPAQWTQGAWITATTPPYYAQINVGPAGAVTLPVGTYVIWVRVDAAPQSVQFPVGKLIIY